MKKPSKLFLLSLVALAACQHVGAGEGTLSPTHAPRSPEAEARPQTVKFYWRSGFDAGNGDIRAVVSAGSVYTGSFAQIRARLETDTTGPHVVGWFRPKWAEDPWYGGLPETVAGVNTARVVALLNAADGSQMRCKFQLHDVDAGMVGGASGQCLLSAGFLISSAELRERSN